MNNSAKRVSVELTGWRAYLTPADLHRDIEWLGTVRRGAGETGALGRVRATGLLVQVNGGVFRALDQRKAQQALTFAIASSR